MMINIASVDTRITYRFFAIALHKATLVMISILFPLCVFGQTGISSRTQSAAFARDEGQSGVVEQGESTGLKIFALRLRPGQDLRKEIEKFTKEKGIKAGFIITTVGSLEKASLRLTNQDSPSNFEGKFEIVSLVGTLSQDGVHLHISLSDNTGKTIGGHLVAGCEIYTTAEIVVGEANGIVFKRETDRLTGYKELTIRRSTRTRKK